MTEARTDEISLVDLWIIFSRHKRAFWLTLALFLMAGIPAVLFLPKHYSYTTLVEIGTHVMGDQTQPIESPQSVATKLKKSYVPQALESWYKQHPNDKKSYDFDVTTPKDTLLVEIDSKGKAGQSPVFQFVHRNAVALLKTDHDHILAVMRQNLHTKLVGAQTHLQTLQQREGFLKAKLVRLKTTQQNAMAQARRKARLLKAKLPRVQGTQKNKLADLEAQAKTLKAEQNGLDKRERLVREEITKYQDLLDSAEKQWDQATQEATTPTRAMTLLMLTNQIQQTRSHLSGLRQQLAVDIPNKREELRNKLAENGRAQQNLQNAQASEFDELQASLENRQREVDNLAVNQAAARDDLADKIDAAESQQEQAKADVSELKTRLENLRRTHSIALASRSLKPVNVSGLIILLGAGFLGAGFGIMAVLVLEVRSNVRAKVQV
ncbi:MAG: hypothetical protein PVI37_11535 [Gammaproteobacteria bacterium]